MREVEHMTKQIVEVPELNHDLKMKEQFGNKISPNGRLERRIIANLIDYMNKLGWLVVGVWDGDTFEQASDARGAMEFIFNLDEASLRFVKAEGFDSVLNHEKTRDYESRNCWAAKEHGVLIVLGNGCDMISDWNYYEGDEDGFNTAMENFNAEDFA